MMATNMGGDVDAVKVVDPVLSDHHALVLDVPMDRESMEHIYLHAMYNFKYCVVIDSILTFEIELVLWWIGTTTSTLIPLPSFTLI